jgi:hypothetical protein
VPKDDDGFNENWGATAVVPLVDRLAAVVVDVRVAAVAFGLTLPTGAMTRAMRSA